MKQIACPLLPLLWLLHHPAGIFPLIRSCPKWSYLLRKANLEFDTRSSLSRLHLPHWGLYSVKKEPLHPVVCLYLFLSNHLYIYLKKICLPPPLANTDTRYRSSCFLQGGLHHFEFTAAPVNPLICAAPLTCYPCFCEKAQILTDYHWAEHTIINWWTIYGMNIRISHHS